jgi:hypothetical protein
MKSFPRAILTALLFATVCGSFFPANAAEESWKTQVVGIMVTAPEGSLDNRSFCWKSGVTVSAALSSPNLKIVEVDSSGSKINSFTDDKGTDLMDAPDSKDVFNKPGVSVQLPSGDKGFTSVIMDLKALGHPAKDATMLKISGKVAAQVAGDSKQATIDNAEIKPETTFKAGEISIKISDASMKKGYSGKEEFIVTFSGTTDLKNISKVEFFDAQGTVIESSKRSWGGGLGSYRIEYALKKSVDRAKIVVSYWTDLKTVEIPFNIKTSVGFGER